MSLTMEQLAEWKSYETTKKVLKIFEDEMSAIIGTIAEGGILGDTIDSTAQLANRTVGRLEGLKFIFELEEELDEE